MPIAVEIHSFNVCHALGGSLRPWTGPGLAVALLVLCACSPDFDSPSKVTSFRLLAIKAEPPEISAPLPQGAAPGPYERPRNWATLTAFVADPNHLSNPGKKSTVLYFACTPNPANPDDTACTSFDDMRDPLALVSAVSFSEDLCAQRSSDGSAPAHGIGVLGGISFSGVEACDASGCAAASVALDPLVPNARTPFPAPVYVMPSTLNLDALAPGTATRTLGTYVVVLSIAIDAAPEEVFSGANTCAAAPARLRNLLQTRREVDSVKRITVRGPDSVDEPNQNPVITDIVGRDDAALPQSVPLGQEITLFPKYPSDALFQQVSKYDSNGAVIETKAETWVYSWFATSGELNKEQSWSDNDYDEKWTSPGGTSESPMPPTGTVRLYLVGRDQRGGTTWLTHDFALSR